MLPPSPCLPTGPSVSTGSERSLGKLKLGPYSPILPCQVLANATPPPLSANA